MEKQLEFRESRKNLEKYLAFISQNRHPIVFVLDRLENKRNIAALYRLADAARIEHIYLYQAQVSEDSQKIKRISRSTHEYIESSLLSSEEELIKLKEHYELVALENTTHSIPYYQFDFQKPIALLIGNEKRGISKELLMLCDRSVHIPMMGRNTSMNVAMATGIATYGLLERMGHLPK